MRKCHSPFPPISRRNLSVAVLLFALIFSGFCLTGSVLQFGYEGYNIAEAESWVTGVATPPGKSGLIEVAAYLPSAWVKAKLAETGKLVSMQGLAYVFVQPFIAALICLAVFGFGLDLYRQISTAVAVALTASFATMIWPYSKFGMENQQALWVLTAVWALFHYEKSPGWKSALAFSLSLVALALTKLTGVMLCTALMACVLWILLSRRLYARREFWAHAGLVALVGIAGLAVLTLSTHMRYGGWLFAGRYNVGKELGDLPILSSVAALLISPNKSIFLYNPPLLIAVLYFGVFLKRFPSLRVVWVVMGMVVLWSILRMRYFNDETWGTRRLLFIVPLAALSLGVWWERRKYLGFLQRGIAWIVIALGIFVQLVAVSFDYTSHAFTLGATPLYSIENTVWLPELNHVGFNLHLYRSLISRHQGKGSLDFVFEQDYTPCDSPLMLPKPQRFSVARYDHLDLWYLQQSNQFPSHTGSVYRLRTSRSDLPSYLWCRWRDWFITYGL